MRGYPSELESVSKVLDAHFPLPPSPRFFLRALFGVYDSKTRLIALWALEYLIWPWLTVAGLMVFQITLRRSRIRVSHLMRCTIYSADVVPVLIASALLFTRFVLKDRGIAYNVAWYLPIITIVILWLAPTIRLMVAVRSYLRIPAPAATVILTQVMFLLLLGFMAEGFGIPWVDRIYWFLHR